MTYNWTKEEQINKPIKQYTYGTTFSGAGGTSLGLEYLNRFQNIFYNELDSKQSTLYNLNLNPLYGFDMPIQELVSMDLSDKPEMFDLDVLQASPPCSLYSAANNNAEQMKGQDSSKFSCSEDGGMCQVIDELYQPAIELCGKLRPKVFIIENVTGLLFKKNKVYVDDIYKRLTDLGYKTIHSTVKGENIGLPQSRNRVFFISIREDLEFNEFNLDFNEPKALIKDIKYTDEPTLSLTPHKLALLEHYQEEDKHLGHIRTRLDGKNTGFGTKINVPSRDIFSTITTKSDVNIVLNVVNGRNVFTSATPQQLIQAQSFPLDYNFNGKSIYYALGMSVPPLMIAKIVERIEKSILEPFYAK
jgi:DNA (cytosine-5)-methyltransferase 1